MNVKLETVFYKTLQTCEYVIDDFLNLKKFYGVEILDSGKWHNVCVGTRFFLTRKSAKEFYNNITTINECKAIFKTYSRLSGVCYGED
jgi:hypothetical protein